LSDAVCWWHGRGCRGTPRPSRRTAYSQTLCLPPLGAEELAVFAWLSAVDEAFFARDGVLNIQTSVISFISPSSVKVPGGPW